MTLVSGSIPNLVGGVSQQPASARFVNQLDDCVNMLPSIVEGLRRRPPTEHRRSLADYLALNPPAAYVAPFVHFIPTAPRQRVGLLVENGQPALYDLQTGARLTLNASAAVLAYLATSNPRLDLGALTVADTTFVWNRSVLVGQSAARSPARTNEGLIFVRAGAYARTYSVNVTIGGTTYVVSYRTPTGSNADQGNGIDAVYIASVLADSAQAVLSAYTAGGAVASTTRLNSIPGLTVTRNSSVIRISAAVPIEVTTADGQGDDLMTYTGSRVRRFSALPRVAWNGFTTLVSQEPGNTDDDYYVRYDDPPTGDAEGIWRETVGPDVPLGLDPATMPVIIRPTAVAGVWEAVQAAWGQRTAGNESTAPDPDFVGRRINGMSFFRSRLVVLAGETVSFSDALDSFQFYRSSVATSLPTEPFSLTNPTARRVDLLHAAAFNERLVVFGDTLQLQVSSPDIFTAETAGIVPTTEFETVAGVAPQSAGSSLLFISERGLWSAMREYFVDQVTSTNATTDNSAQVPAYIPRNVFSLAVSPKEEMALILSADVPQSLWLYRWYQAGNQRSLQSWSEWRLGRNILGLSWVDSQLYLITQTADALQLEVMDVSPGATDPAGEYLTHLDRRVSEAGVNVSFGFDPFFNRTPILLPYSAPDGILLVTRAATGQIPGVAIRLTRDPQNPRLVYAPGNYTSRAFYIGVPYRSSLTFSTFYPRDGGHANSGPAILSGRTNIVSLSVGLAKTGHLEAEVTPTGGTTWRYQFTARLIDSPENRTDTVPLEDAPFRIPVQANNERVRISLFTEAYLPCQILNAEWVGRYVNFSQRA